MKRVQPLAPANSRAISSDAPSSVRDVLATIGIVLAPGEKLLLMTAEHTHELEAGLRAKYGSPASALLADDTVIDMRAIVTLKEQAFDWAPSKQVPEVDATHNEVELNDPAQTLETPSTD